jgi:hypothetical protein
MNSTYFRNVSYTTYPRFHIDYSCSGTVCLAEHEVWCTQTMSSLETFSISMISMIFFKNLRLNCIQYCTIGLSTTYTAVKIILKHLFHVEIHSVIF